MAKLATIDLDWLDGYIQKLESRHFPLGEDLSSDIFMARLFRSKCHPIEEQSINGYKLTSGSWTNATIEEPQLGTIKENAWNTGFIGIETREPSPLFQISPEDKNVGAMLPYDNKVTFSTSGANQSLVLSEENRKSKWTNATIEDVKQEPFLSKTCTNNWEDKKFCENTGKCELCKIKISPTTENDPR